ncbi:hypothetical protein AK89_08370 [Enterococcus mundtii CRL35]|nr:hypothetical protein AK89_08370 [Enterococcus mundtii CRL35]
MIDIHGRKMLESEMIFYGRKNEQRKANEVAFLCSFL